MKYSQLKTINWDCKILRKHWNELWVVCLFFLFTWKIWFVRWRMGLVFKTMSVSTWEACPNSSSVAWPNSLQDSPSWESYRLWTQWARWDDDPQAPLLEPPPRLGDPASYVLGPCCSLYWKGFLSRLLPGCIFTQISSSGLLVQGGRFGSPSLKPPSWFPPQALF